MMCYFFILLLLVLTGWSATIYVDPAAVGANDGTSWANAYNNVTNVYKDTGKVAPGDTVELSGGTYTNLQEFRLEPGTSGAWVTYKSSQDVGHNSQVVMSNMIIMLHYTTLSGAKSANCETNFNTASTFDTTQITNYCNIFIIRDWGAFETNSGGNSINVFSAPAIVEWVRVHGARDWAVTDPPQFEKSHSASEVFCYSDDPDVAASSIRYIWVDQSSGHGAGAAVTVASHASYFGAWDIHHSLFETNWSDVCNISGGVDYHHNVIRHRMGAGHQGCNDTFTISGTTAYIRIHNNLIEPGDNTGGYLPPDVSTNAHDFFFYNNLYTPTSLDDRGQDQQMGMGMEQGSAYTAVAYYITTNFWFFNNTAIGTTNGGVDGFISLMTRSPQTNELYITGPEAMQFKNNIFAQIDTNSIGNPAYRPLGLAGGTNTTGQGWHYQTNTLVVDYNLFSTRVAGNLIAAAWATNCTETAIILTNATDIFTTTGWPSNRSETATRFVDGYVNFDWRPSDASVMFGTNLTSLTNLMPDINTDLYGITRPATGPWSVGAIEYTGLTNGLMLWLTFDNDDGWTTNHTITDRSGMGNDAYYCASTNRETWPSLTNGPGGLSAAQFKVTLTNGFRYGTYAAVTSLSTNADCGLISFTNASWSLWAYIDDEHILGDSGYDAFLTTGQDSNNWNFGKYYSASPHFWAPHTDGGNDPHWGFANWPDCTTNTGWQHYCMVWDGTNMIPYLNGALYSDTLTWTNENSSDVTNKFVGTLTSTNLVGASRNWIAVGVNTHSGTWDPDDADDLPNNGQLWGKLADIRIYNRPLLATEVQAIYNFAGLPKEEEPPTIVTNRVYVTGTVRAGQVRPP